MSTTDHLSDIPTLCYAESTDFLSSGDTVLTCGSGSAMTSLADGSTDDYSDISAQTRSSVWRWFLRSGDRTHAKCRVCGVALRIPNGATTGLSKHILTKHKRDPNTAVPPPSFGTTGPSHFYGGSLRGIPRTPTASAISAAVSDLVVNIDDLYP